MERTLQKIRNSKVPKAPATCEEIKKAFENENVFDEYGMSKHTDRREIFFNTIYESSAFSYCIFSSQTIIKLMDENIDRNRKKILMDATFKIVPAGPFKQFLVIYVEHMSMVIRHFQPLDHSFLTILIHNLCNFFRYIHSYSF